jgi:hypothetical protein
MRPQFLVAAVTVVVGAQIHTQAAHADQLKIKTELDRALAWACANGDGDGRTHLVLGASLAHAHEPVVWRISRPPSVTRATLEFRAVVDRDEGGPRGVTDGNRKVVHLSREAILTVQDITRVEVSLQPDQEHHAVTLHFTPRAAKRLHDATSPSDRRIAVLVDGYVWTIVTPVIPLESSAMFGNHDFLTARWVAARLAP